MGKKREQEVPGTVTFLCRGDQKALQGIVKKIAGMAKACVRVEEIIQRDILPAVAEDYGDQEDVGIWQTGAYAGIMISFVNSLTEKEKDFHFFYIRDEMRKTLGDRDDVYNPLLYMETARTVLERFGYHVPEAGEVAGEKTP